MSTIIKNNNDQYQTRNERLGYLDNLDDWKVHHDDVDPRGYTVKLADGFTVGKVEGLVADTTAKKVRYVEIEIDDDAISDASRSAYNDDDLHILVPVGLIRIDKTTDSVFVDGLGADHVSNYPRYNRNNGYTTSYEIDTNDYLASYHDYGSSYDRNRFSTDDYRSRNMLDDDFYNSRFYVG